MMWYNERLKTTRSGDIPKFSICCLQGKSKFLSSKNHMSCSDLFFYKGLDQSKRFLSEIRTYNNMFSFTSMGGKIDHNINANGRGAYSSVIGGKTTIIWAVYFHQKIQGQFTHSFTYMTQQMKFRIGYQQ